MYLDRSPTGAGKSTADIPAMVEYFRGGASRGSNEWIERCDLLIVLGTPRVPPSVVKSHLIRLGKIVAAARDGHWTTRDRLDCWSAVTVTGRRRSIRSPAYRDHDWYAAHRSLVAAELIQSIGRARTICEHGIPVVVVSPEPLGLRVVDRDPVSVSRSDLEVLRAVQRLSGANAKGASQGAETELSGAIANNVLAIAPLSSGDIAKAAKRDQQHTIRVLRRLHSVGLVRRVGQRGGWTLPLRERTEVAGGDGAADGQRG